MRSNKLRSVGIGVDVGEVNKAVCDVEPSFPSRDPGQWNRGRCRGIVGIQVFNQSLGEKRSPDEKEHLPDPRTASQNAKRHEEDMEKCHAGPNHEPGQLRGGLAVSQGLQH